MKCQTHGQNCDGDCVDPNVDNGMMTKIWGPPGWLFLHCVTFGYPYAINSTNPEHKTKAQDYANFFYYLGKVMPCRYCRESYMKFIEEHPIDNNLKTRKDLTKWFYDIHNKVNNKLGLAKCHIPSFEEVQESYEQYRAKCKKTTDEERENNQAKGCVTPADGTKKRCVVKVVKCAAGDITRRDNADVTADANIPKSDDYLVMEKKHALIYAIILLLLLIAIWNRVQLTKWLKKNIKFIK